MAFCRNCGQEIPNEATVCVHCGVAQNPQPQTVDNGGFLWGLLGWFVPIVGLILYLVWMDTKPKTAKAVGIGALASVIVGIILCVIIFIFGFWLLGMTGIGLINYALY
ncbi:MAG: zinc ribbon domain-containing protein [Lachnospiraceae bacterium]|nr:zinc ribbon domain-containing protein [Lachnospiraceae bacterium]